MEPREEDRTEASQGEPVRIKPRRIDPPHVMGGHSGTASVPQSVPAEARAGESPVAAYGVIPAIDDSSGMPEPEDELTIEASQLAENLESQLREIEHREARVHARMAEVENEWRACQMWHHQRIAELSEREDELRLRQAEMEAFERRQQELAERQTDCEAHEAQLDQREARLAEREATYVGNEHELRMRRQEVERQAAALSRAQQLWEQTRRQEEQVLAAERVRLEAEMEEKLEQRLRDLEAGESLLAERTGQLDSERELFRREREAWQHEQRLAQQQRADSERRLQSESHDREAQLAARESALDTQQAALEQLRSEVLAAHRQALEMRLIAEQLWAQLKGLMTPAEITHSLAQMRLKLAEQYELEEKSLADKKEELLTLAEKLAEQHAALKAQRIEFLSWRKSQSQEIQQQAEHLCRRIAELDEERKALAQREQAWHAERRQLEERLSDLTGRLCHLPAAA